MVVAVKIAQTMGDAKKDDNFFRNEYRQTVKDRWRERKAQKMAIPSLLSQWVLRLRQIKRWLSMDRQMTDEIEKMA